MTPLKLKTAKDQTSKPFEALPAGRYNLVVESAEVKRTHKGDPMITTTFVVGNGKFKNRKLWHNFPLGEKSLPFLVIFLQKGKRPDLLERDDMEPEELAFQMEDIKISAYTEPGTTPAGTPKNELKNWGEYQKSNDEDEEDLPDFIKEDTPEAMFQ